MQSSMQNIRRAMSRDTVHRGSDSQAKASHEGQVTSRIFGGVSPSGQAKSKSIPRNTRKDSSIKMSRLMANIRV